MAVAGLFSPIPFPLSSVVTSITASEIISHPSESYQKFQLHINWSVSHHVHIGSSTAPGIYKGSNVYLVL